MAETNKTKLYKKMFEIMKTVEHVEKTIQVKYKTVDYKATSEAVVTPIFRKEFIKNKLMVFPIEQISVKSNGISRIDIKYKIVDTETGENEILASSGEGADTQDKGAGKAMTYAYKYMLLRTFMSPTGEDPDKTSSQELDDKRKQKESKGNGKSALTQTQVKKLFLEYHKGDKAEAKEDYELWADMEEPIKSDTLENIKERVEAA